MSAAVASAELYSHSPQTARCWFTGVNSTFTTNRLYRTKDWAALAS